MGPDDINYQPLEEKAIKAVWKGAPLFKGDAVYFDGDVITLPWVISWRGVLPDRTDIPITHIVVNVEDRGSVVYLRSLKRIQESVVYEEK